MINNKSELRMQMIAIRKKISDKKKKSTIIVDKILNLDIYKKSKNVALYNSMLSEVDTSCLISKSYDKVILLPKIVDDKMIFVKINKNTKYHKSNIGVLEPIGDEYFGHIDLIIVPGVAFDREGNRLGFGKGFYDRYLTNTNIYKIGICFDDQIVNFLPHNKLDIKMNMIVTEKRVY